MADKYAKKVKLSRGAIITIVCTLLVIVGVVLFAVFYNAGDSISKAYSLDKDHVFEEVKYKNLGKVINSDEPVFVFFGNPDCESCVKYIGTVNEYAKAYEVSKIYYLNSSKLSSEQLKEIEANYKLSDAKEDKILTKYTPQIWVFKNGKLLDLSMKYMKDNDVEQMTYEQLCSVFFREYGPLAK